MNCFFHSSKILSIDSSPLSTHPLRYFRVFSHLLSDYPTQIAQPSHHKYTDIQLINQFYKEIIFCFFISFIKSKQLNENQHSHATIFSCIFDIIEDPKCNKCNTIDHPLTEMMFLVISAAVSGFITWTDIQLFGEERLDWLRKFFPYKKGIPWHGTLGRVFARLDNERFGAYFIEWIGSLSELTKGEVVAIDRKRMRGSYDKSDGKDAIHMVSAYAQNIVYAWVRLPPIRKAMK